LRCGRSGHSLIEHSLIEHSLIEHGLIEHGLTWSCALGA
jgi:hypothetical protein